MGDSATRGGLTIVDGSGALVRPALTASSSRVAVAAAEEQAVGVPHRLEHVGERAHRRLGVRLERAAQIRHRARRLEALVKVSDALVARAEDAPRDGARPLEQ